MTRRMRVVPRVTDAYSMQADRQGNLGREIATSQAHSTTTTHYYMHIGLCLFPNSTRQVLVEYVLEEGFAPDLLFHRALQPLATRADRCGLCRVWQRPRELMAAFGGPLFNSIRQSEGVSTLTTATSTPACPGEGGQVRGLCDTHTTAAAFLEGTAAELEMERSVLQQNQNKRNRIFRCGSAPTWQSTHASVDHGAAGSETATETEGLGGLLLLAGLGLGGLAGDCVRWLVGKGRGGGVDMTRRHNNWHSFVRLSATGDYSRHESKQRTW